MEPEHTASDVPLDVLERYAAGECTAAECATLEALFACEPRAVRVLTELRRAALGVAEPPVWDARAAWDELQHLMGSEHADERGVRDPTTRTPWLSRVPIARIAGIAALTIIGVVAAAVLRRPTAHDAVRSYHTAAGQRATIALADGSQIVLAPRTTLTLAGGFDRGARQVTLAGQAYFTVTHDARRPFTVRTGAVQTEVLGTAFDVRHYEDDAVVRIRVVDGKVASRGRGGRGTPVLLVAGTEGQLTDSTALLVMNRDAGDADAWTRGRLVFDETPVPDMLRTLQRWYGYEFRLADSALARRQVTAMFSVGDTVKTMARLKMLLDVTLRFDGSVVTLSPVHQARKGGSPVRRPALVFPSQSEVGK